MNDLQQRLGDLGFYTTDVTMAHAVSQYQAFHGLKVDGFAGPVTKRHLTMPRHCSLPDYMPQRSEVLKFPGREVTYANAHAVPGFDRDETEAITDLACDEWNRTSGLTANRTTNPKTATILLTVGNIDGRNGTLAWSELAKLPQTIQRYDKHEPWKRGDGWTPAAYPYIDLLLVMLHELGHAFGLEHAPGGDNLLSPIYSPANVRPGKWEIEQMQRRYGKPAKVDEPEPPAAVEGVTLFIPGARVL